MASKSENEKRTALRQDRQLEVARALAPVLVEARHTAFLNLRMTRDALCKVDKSSAPDTTSLSRYESGHRIPCLSVLLSLAEVYGVKPSLLLKRAGLDDITMSVEGMVRAREAETGVGFEEEGENIRSMLYIPAILRDEVGALAAARGQSFSKLIAGLMRKEIARVANRTKVS